MKSGHIRQSLLFTKAAGASLLFCALASCAQWSYPTQSEIHASEKDVPALDTIISGRAYLLVVRNDMIGTRTQLQRLGASLDGGILVGAVTLALGTALHWGSHTTITAGILTGAALGTDSALSIKTQIQIINKGLDALNCVEFQAESAYVSVQPIDAMLRMIGTDVLNLEAAIDKFSEMGPIDVESSDTIATAVVDVSNAKAWLLVSAIPVATVNNGVKIGINAVLQTTVDQLNSTLPDGSAFAKISAATPGQPASSTTAPVPAQQTATSKNTGVNDPQLYAATKDLTDAQKQSLANALKAKQKVISLASRLNSDMVAAKTTLEKLSTATLAAPLPNINCAGSSAIQAFQVSSFSGVLVPNPASSTSATIAGGSTPYSVGITASTSGLNPEAFVKSISDKRVVLTGSSSLKPGTYQVTVSEHSGAEKTQTLTVAAAPLAPKLTNPTSMQTWQQGKYGTLVLPPDTFTDPQGEALLYSVTQSNGQPLPTWLHFDSATRTLASASPAVAGSWSLKVTATNSTVPSLSAAETFVLAVQ